MQNCKLNIFLIDMSGYTIMNVTFRQQRIQIICYSVYSIEVLEFQNIPGC